MYGMYSHTVESPTSGPRNLPLFIYRFQSAISTYGFIVEVSLIQEFQRGSTVALLLYWAGRQADDAHAGDSKIKNTE